MALKRAIVSLLFVISSYVSTSHAAGRGIITPPGTPSTAPGTGGLPPIPPLTITPTAQAYDLDNELDMANDALDEFKRKEPRKEASPNFILVKLRSMLGALRNKHPDQWRELEKLCANKNPTAKLSEDCVKALKTSGIADLRIEGIPVINPDSSIDRSIQEKILHWAPNPSKRTH